MKYIGNQSYQHGNTLKTGVLITNLGTPEAPEKKALRVYLKEFLSDPRVVEVPRLIWWLILNLVILNIRPSRSAAAYKTVWTERGSPLLVHTQDQCNALASRLDDEFGESVVVDFAMRYGNPSIKDRLALMRDAGVDRLIVLPLYPQYAGATTGSTFDALSDSFRSERWVPDLKFIGSYHDRQSYIEACVAAIQVHWDSHGRADKLLLSYHGIPKKYLLAGDPYHCQCHKTSRLIAEGLGLKEDEYLTTFQSRFGREEWLKPYTDHTLQSLPGQGCRSIQVFCPGFSADCLETVEEIGVENRDYFLESGGERYEYIEALNAREKHIDFMVEIVKESIVHRQETMTREQAEARYQSVKELMV